MLDKYVIGDNERNSPEAAVPVIRKTSTEYRLGGAGNVALNLLGLEVHSTLISVLGEDEAGKQIKELCRTQKVSSRFIEIKDRPTTVKERIVDKKFNQFLRVDTEITEDVARLQ